MTRSVLSSRLIRVLAVLFALSMLAVYVTVRSQQAGREGKKTRASSSKSQNISSVYNAARNAGALAAPAEELKTGAPQQQTSEPRLKGAELLQTPDRPAPPPGQ